ncbi:MAG TPA: gamma-glutamyltransferase, partial [Candidatus Lustribacter sp.]|nr:gamma-glutamyltransferase [Candidatus Lustribacter sp.]
VGGPLLKVMLSESARRQGRTWLDVIEIQRHVLTYRHHVHDHSPDLEEDGYRLLERVERHGLAGLPTSSSTAHISVVDDAGTACAITASSGYGSGATLPGTGLMMNNCLGEPELNRIGLHALAPGTRLASNMAPTVGHGAGGARLAIGSPGADRITTALLQVLVRYCLMGVGLQEAIDRPRLHIRLLPDGSPQVEFEDDPDMDAAVTAAGLPALGHPAKSMYFGGVGAAHLGADRALSAAADARREAATGVSPARATP